MKKIGLLIFFFLTLSLTMFSQRFNGGVLFGGAVSQVDGDGYGGFAKFGYLGGGLISLRISPRSSFQMELEYIQKGSRINADTLTNSSTTYLMRFHYLEIPVLYQYTFAKRFSIETGPAMDVLLGSLEQSDGLDVSSTVPLRPVTLAGIFGFSGFISQHLKLNLRVNYSLLSIRKPVDTPPSTYRHILFEKGQYNNLLSLSLFWYFKPFDRQ